MARQVLLVTPIVLLLLFAAAEAAVPRQISLSGIRTNVTSGPEMGFTHLNVNFTIFEAAAGGRILDTRLINITTNANGFWFTNYSTRGFDTEVDMWLSINNTAPRIFLGGDPYSGQYLKRNESNTVNSTLTLSNAATISGLLGQYINATSGLNASAMLYGLVPQAVLDLARTWTTTQTFTAGQRFANVNISGNVNITLGAVGTKPLAVYHSDGTERFSVETGNTQVNFASEVNITQTGIPALAVRSGTGVLYFVVDTFSGNTSAFGIFNAINNALFGNATIRTGGILNHSVGGKLVNETGGINASAIGQASSGELLQKAVIPVYGNGSATPHVQGGLFQFGNIIVAAGATSNPENRVNMSVSYSCQWCYVVMLQNINATSGTESGGVWRVRNFNASSFDIQLFGGVPAGYNMTWMAVGY